MMLPPDIFDALVGELANEETGLSDTYDSLVDDFIEHVKDMSREDAIDTLARGYASAIVEIVDSIFDEMATTAETQYTQKQEEATARFRDCKHNPDQKRLF